MSESHRAALVLVATPIGNYDDLSPRAQAELAAADSVACEDSRRTGALFAHYDIAHQPFIVCNDHTEHHAAVEIVRRVEAGQRVALVSDAGTPAVSDPGYRVVQLALDAGIAVESIPGPSAVLTALTLSGFATDRFCFEGFLPRKGGERTSRLHALTTEDRTTVLFESPRRLANLIDELCDRLGPERNIAIARELTKTFETVWRGRLVEAVEFLATNEPKGEIVVVIDGAGDLQVTDDQIVEQLATLIDEGTSRRDAVAEVVSVTGATKRRVYDLANGL